MNQQPSKRHEPVDGESDKPTTDEFKSPRTRLLVYGCLGTAMLGAAVWMVVRMVQGDYGVRVSYSDVEAGSRVISVTFKFFLGFAITGSAFAWLAIEEWRRMRKK